MEKVVENITYRSKPIEKKRLSFADGKRAVTFYETEDKNFSTLDGAQEKINQWWRS